MPIVCLRHFQCNPQYQNLIAFKNAHTTLTYLTLEYIRTMGTLFHKQEMHVNQRQISVKPNAATYDLEKET